MSKPRRDIKYLKLNMSRNLGSTLTDTNVPTLCDRERGGNGSKIERYKGGNNVFPRSLDPSYMVT